MVQTCEYDAHSQSFATAVFLSFMQLGYVGVVYTILVYTRSELSSQFGLTFTLLLAAIQYFWCSTNKHACLSYLLVVYPSQTDS